MPFNRGHLQLAFQLYREGFISSIQKGSTSGPDKNPVEVTPDNISSRRLWLDLKYRNNEPVIREFSLISTPGRKAHLTDVEVKALASGLQVRFIKPLQPSECLFIQNKKKEILEIQEAAKRDELGLALCRIR